MQNTRSPMPSTALFISQLAARIQGDKVRFLGCVERYDAKTATLELFHKYPKDAKRTLRVFVNISPILDTIQNTVLEVGAWINVIGYITPPLQRVVKSARQHTVAELPTVQAIMIWSAGTISLDDYEKALTGRQNSGT